ncbi:MAG: D-glycero-beta-D-manno-heptose-7-phosphate kinase [Bacteroidia bacterium]|nr:D-glycero-beta-D-manno-heptose-7-phosphate kinase [Bacteroidia bacterium]
MKKKIKKSSSENKLSKQGLKNIFDAFTKLKILIIGDVMIDTYLFGTVSRISPEAPVPVVSIRKKESRLGGAANVALNVQAMGATPILCSVIGADSEGDVFLDLLREQNLSQKGILKSRKRITTKKTRIIGNNHQMIRIDDEVDMDISKEETSQLLLRISTLIKHDQIDAIIFEDYDKGLITPKLIQQIIKISRKKGIPTIVDPKKKNFMHYKGVDMFKPNLKELKEGLKIEFNHYKLKELNKITNEFRGDQKIGTLLITLSELGIYINTDEKQVIIPAHIRRIADVSGAGDTVVSIAALCLALNLSPIVMATLANLAGGLVCEYVGVVPINKKQLLQEALNTGIAK